MPAADETVAVAEPAPLTEPASTSEDTTLASSPDYTGDGGGSTDSAVDAFGHYCDDPSMAGPPAPPADGSAPTPEQLLAQMKADIAKMNEQIAEAKAKELAELATQADTMSFGLFEVGDLSQQQLEYKLAELPPEMRKLVVEKMGSVTVDSGGLDGEQTLSEDQLRHVQETASEVTEDEVARNEREERYQKRLTKNVDAMETAAQAGDRKAIAATLDDMRPSAREDALEKMTPEARAIAEDELEKRRARLERKAERLEQAQHGKSATDGTDEVGIITDMTGLSPSEAEELEEIYGEKFKDDDGKSRSLRKDLKDEFGEDDKETKFITAVLDGDEEAEELGVELAVEYLEDEADAIINSDESGMNDLLRAHGRNPEAAARLAEAFKAKTGEELSEACTDVMDDAEYKEASAYQRGDLRTANVAVLEQGEEERTERVIEEVSEEEGGLAQLAQDTQEHTGKKLDQVLEGQLPDDKAAAIEGEVVAAQDDIKTKRDAFLDSEVAKLEKDPVKYAAAKKKADDIASKLSTELSKGHYLGNNFDVTTPLVGLEPAEVKLVMDSYREQAKSLGKDVELEDDLREKLDGKDLKVANAALSGDKVLTAVALVEQSGDGAFTSVDAAKKAMATLEKPEDRKAFLEKMNQHVGGVKEGEAFDRWVQSETSSFERDELEAMAIVDEDERAATLAQVEISKNAYAGKYAQMMEGLQDEVGGLVGETEEQRAKRRQDVRENDLFTQLSNAGGGNEDAIVDAPAKLKNQRQLDLLNEKMLAADGKTVKQTMQDELSQGRLRAGEKFADGDFEGGQAEAMVAAVSDTQLNDNEDRASAGFEQVRVPDDKLDELAKIEDPVAREQAIEAEKKKARESLLEKADKAAQAQGHASYMALLESELSPAELAVAKDRITDGKVADHNALFEAGDTTVGNLGKKTEKFYGLMQDKTPEQMAKLEKDFEAAHPGVDFHEWVISKAGSAGERRDFEIMLEGNYAQMPPEELKKKAADDPRALIKRVKDYHEAARGGGDELKYDPVGDMRRKVGNELGNEMADAYGNAGERLDGRMDAVSKLEAKIDAGEQLTDAEQDELIQHMRYMSGDQQAYTDTKNQIANTSAEAVGTVVEVGTTALTGSTTVGSAVGGLTEMGVKDTLNPARYSNDEKFKDTVNLAADVAGSALGNKYGNDNPFREAAIESVVGGIGQTVGDARNLNDLGQFAEAGTKNVVEQTVTGVVGAGIEDGFGDGLGSKFAQATSDELITGDPTQSGGERVLKVAKSTAKDYAKDKAAKDYRRRQDPTVEAREATDEERRMVEEALAAEEAAAQADGNGNNDTSGDGPSNDGPGGDRPAGDDNGVSVHPIIDIEGDPPPATATAKAPEADTAGAQQPASIDAYMESLARAAAAAAERPSAFGEEGADKRKRLLTGDADHPGLKAKVIGDLVNMTFPEDTSPEQRRELARDALARLGLDAADDAIDAAVAEPGRARIQQRLHVATAERVTETAREIANNAEFAETRKGDTAKSLESKCEKASLQYQELLAERGIHAPVVFAEGNPALGRFGHKFIVVGDTIIDPTLEQFFTETDEKGTSTPFIGPYSELRDRVQAAITNGRMPGYKDADEALARQWGIVPGEEKGTFELDAGVKPLESKGIVPKTVEETRRYIAEQRAAGIPPGQGLPRGLVDQAQAVDAREGEPPRVHTDEAQHDEGKSQPDDGPSIQSEEATPLEEVEATRAAAEVEPVERAELDVQPDPDAPLRPVDLAAMAEKDRSDAEERRTADPDIEVTEATADERREAERAKSFERLWDMGRWLGDKLLPSDRTKKANEAGGAVIDHLAVDKLNPIDAPEVFDAIKTQGDVQTVGIAMLDVLAHAVDPTRSMDDVDRGALGNTVFTVTTKLAEVMIESKVPGLGKLFGKGADAIKDAASRTVPNAMELLGEISHIVARGDGEGLKKMLQTIKKLAGFDDDVTPPATEEPAPDVAAQPRIRIAVPEAAQEEPARPTTEAADTTTQEVIDALAADEAVEALTPEERAEVKRFFD